MLTSVRRTLDPVIWYVVTIVVVLAFMIPVVTTIATSLKSDKDILSLPPTWIF